MRVLHMTLAPYLLQQLLLRDHSARVHHQLVQQIEFLLRKVMRLAGDDDRTLLDIDLQIAIVKI